MNAIPDQSTPYPLAIGEGDSGGEYDGDEDENVSSGGGCGRGGAGHELFPHFARPSLPPAKPATPVKSTASTTSTSSESSTSRHLTPLHQIIYREFDGLRAERRREQREWKEASSKALGYIFLHIFQPIKRSLPLHLQSSDDALLLFRHLRQEYSRPTFHRCSVLDKKIASMEPYDSSSDNISDWLSGHYKDFLALTSSFRPGQQIISEAFFLSGTGGRGRRG
jgi:hypothetical protein